MKHTLIIVVLTVAAANDLFAQKQPDPLPYNKERLDSLFRSFPKPNQPLILPLPKGYFTPENSFAESSESFEAVNPGASVINKTSRGTIYNMPLDNMAVLVPEVNMLENMPGSKPHYTPAPRNKMPNPLKPDVYPKKYKKF